MSQMNTTLVVMYPSSRTFQFGCVQCFVRVHNFTDRILSNNVSVHSETNDFLPKPRAATSVAKRIGVLPLLNSKKAI